jgi:CRISPR/Cas system CSM-associated protein Csm3 (group 7 of RAMP superfamily)
MFVKRDEIELVLFIENLTPLHVGSDGTREISRVGGVETAETAMAAVICRDAKSQPYIPGSTLKGALRRICELGGATGKEVSALFGEIKNKQSGAAGLMTVYGAHAVGQAPDATAMPYYSAGDPGIFLSARTKIDPRIGVAEEHLLFFREMAAPGWRFETRIVLRRPYKLSETSERWLGAKTLFLRLGATLKDGQISIGKGQADADGECAITVISASALDADPLVRPFATWRIELRCKGPFLTIDSSRKAQKDDDKSTRASVFAQKARSDAPLVNGSSISGALRARLTRLMRVESLKASAQGKAPPDESLVSRLFGETERAALLRLRRLHVHAEEKMLLTQVSLDRLTAGPMDRLLFRTEAFRGVTIEVDLELRCDDEACRKAVALLCADIAANGLELGAGASKGFGWFNVEVAAARGAAGGAIVNAA